MESIPTRRHSRRGLPPLLYRTDSEYLADQEDLNDPSETDFQETPIAKDPVEPTHEGLLDVDPFTRDHTGTTKDKTDPKDPGPTSGPKLTTSSGKGAIVDRKKGNTTGPGLASLGKRKRRKTVRRSKRRKTPTSRRSRQTRSKKTATSRRSHRTRSKRKRSRMSNKTRASTK